MYNSAGIGLGLDSHNIKLGYCTKRTKSQRERSNHTKAKIKTKNIRVFNKKDKTKMAPCKDNDRRHCTNKHKNTEYQDKDDVKDKDKGLTPSLTLTLTITL